MGRLQQVRVFQGCSVPQTNGAVPGDGGSWQAGDKGLESWQKLCCCSEAVPLLGAQCDSPVRALAIGALVKSQRWFDHDTSGSVCSCSVFSPPIPCNTYTHHLHFPLPLKCRDTCSCVLILLSVPLPKLSSKRLSFIL